MGLWFSYGFSNKTSIFPWFSDGFPIKPPFSYGFLWFSYGFPMVFPIKPTLLGIHDGPVAPPAHWAWPLSSPLEPHFEPPVLAAWWCNNRSYWLVILVGGLICLSGRRICNRTMIRYNMAILVFPGLNCSQVFI